MISKDLIKRKISLIQDDIGKLSSMSNYSMQEIVSDFMKQATVERLLERIISRAIDINEHIIAESPDLKLSPPKDYRETFIYLADIGIYPKDFSSEIAKSIGTRNMLIHEYDKIDYSRVYSSISFCLKDYQKYIDYILNFLEKN